MKKRLGAVFVLIMAFLLAISGCRGNAQTNSAAGSTSQQIVYDSEGTQIDVTSNADTVNVTPASTSQAFPDSS